MPRLLLVSILLCASCGLIPSEPIGFRTYELREISYDEGVDIVRAVTRDVLSASFGGVAMEWDPEQRNLRVDPIFQETRRLELYVHVEPASNGVDVQMFAVVTHLQPSADARKLWTDPKQDVYFEEQLHQAFVDEVLARRAAPP